MNMPVVVPWMVARHTKGGSVDPVKLNVISEANRGLRGPFSETSRNVTLVNHTAFEDAANSPFLVKGMQLSQYVDEKIMDKSVISAVEKVQGNSTCGDKKGQGDKREKGDKIERGSNTQHMERKVWEMEDQLIMARAYVHIVQPHGNSHLLRELKLRIREIERLLGRSSRSSSLTGSALQRMRAMEETLTKARRAYPDCSATASKLRAMTRNTEDQLREQQSEAFFLMQVAARTLPKGHHCLAMRLTSEYFSLEPADRQLPDTHSASINGMYHYAIFSDNIVACAVAVNSTISTSTEPHRVAIHIVTDAVNYPSMTMWFLLNPPSPATIEIKSLDDFKWLPGGFSSMFKQKGLEDPRYTSALNHLRFYLPKLFPLVEKIVLLDHDVVVRRDLSKLWELDLKGNVNGAVEMVSDVGVPFLRLEHLLNFKNANISGKFDPNAAVWAFGLNLFDLKEWRKRDLVRTYREWVQKGKHQTLWKAGSLPLGQVIFYNLTVPLDKRWHLLGLGKDALIGRKEIEAAAVLHYDGNLKPWLDIGIPQYRDIWNMFLDYDNIHLQQCNIHK